MVSRNVELPDVCLAYFSENAQTHTATYSKESWPILSPVTCNSDHLIYTISCKRGGHTPDPACRLESQYVGMTGQKAKRRWDAHSSSINPVNGVPTTSVGRHFNLPGHSVDDINFLVIEKVFNTDPHILKARETYWIRKYQTVTHGLNQEE